MSVAKISSVAVTHTIDASMALYQFMTSFSYRKIMLHEVANVPDRFSGFTPEIQKRLTEAVSAPIDALLAPISDQADVPDVVFVFESTKFMSGTIFTKIRTLTAKYPHELSICEAVYQICSGVMSEWKKAKQEAAQSRVAKDSGAKKKTATAKNTMAASKPAAPAAATKKNPATASSKGGKKKAASSVRTVADVVAVRKKMDRGVALLEKLAQAYKWVKPSAQRGRSALSLASLEASHRVAVEEWLGLAFLAGTTPTTAEVRELLLKSLPLLNRCFNSLLTSSAHYKLATQIFVSTLEARQLRWVQNLYSDNDTVLSHARDCISHSNDGDALFSNACVAARGSGIASYLKSVVFAPSRLWTYIVGATALDKLNGLDHGPATTPQHNGPTPLEEIPAKVKQQLHGSLVRIQEIYKRYKIQSPPALQKAITLAATATETIVNDHVPPHAPPVTHAYTAEDIAALEPSPAQIRDFRETFFGDDAKFSDSADKLGPHIFSLLYIYTWQKRLGWPVVVSVSRDLPSGYNLTRQTTGDKQQ